MSLRGLPPLVVTEVLFAAQQRVRGGAKIYDATLRAVCDTLRHEQAPTISSCPADSVSGKATRVLLDVVRLAMSGAEEVHGRRFKRGYKSTRGTRS